MDMGFEGKVAFITGSGSGIGRDMALAFAREGARVVINDINPDAAGETAELVRKAGGDATLAVCNITSLAELKATVDQVLASTGRIDVLVNNAAVMKAHEMFLDTSPEDCDVEIKVALYGTMNCCRAIVPGMVQRRYGKVVSIVTDSARVGQERQCNYSAAKGGVISFTKSFAKEVGRDNVNVNAVSPGATNSPIRQGMLKDLEAKIGAAKLAEREEKVRRMYAMRRIGEPEDISNAVLYLSSDLARHVTGQVLSVNGGFAMPG